MIAVPVQVDLLHVFRARIPRIHRATQVPVVLPRTLTLAGKKFRLYATGGGRRNGWDLELAAARTCGGANACFVASFTAKRGAKLPGRSNLRLATGQRALFHGVSCGASCAPATLWFVRQGILYSWQFKTPPNTKSAMARLAAAAIRAGPR
jgi:hypothetical protein